MHPIASLSPPAWYLARKKEGIARHLSRAGLSSLSPPALVLPPSLPQVAPGAELPSGTPLPLTEGIASSAAEAAAELSWREERKEKSWI